MRKILLSFLAALCCAVTIHATIYNGTCGNDLTWTLDTNTGVLTIEGTGQMTSFSNSSPAPWKEYLTSITSVQITGTPTYIGKLAFSNCTTMTTCTISASVTGIGQDAFYKCTGLTSITCYAVTPPTLAAGVFTRVSADIPIYIPQGSTTAYTESSWGNYFTNFQEMEGQTVFNGTCGETMTWILNTETGALTLNGGGDMYDYDVPSNPAPWYDYRLMITSVSTWDQPTSIGDYAFAGCENLTSTSLSSSIRQIGFNAFDNCISLESIDLPFELEKIKNSAFYHCTGLSYIYIPMGVTSIYDGAFMDANISEFAVSDNNETYCSVNKVIFDKQKTSLIAYPIANERTDYTVPAGVEVIQSYAFYDAHNLTHIDLPESLNDIQLHSFDWCSGLTSITCHAITPPSLNEGFFHVDNSIPVYVPKESVEAYQSSDWATYFSDFRAIGSEGIDQITNDELRMTNKLLRDGMLLIEKNGKTYNALGAEIK